MDVLNMRWKLFCLRALNRSVHLSPTKASPNPKQVTSKSINTCIQSIFILLSPNVALLDVQVRNKLFHVYNTINEFNAWCSIHTNYYFEKGQQNRLLIKELNRITDKTNVCKQLPFFPSANKPVPLIE